MAELKLRQICAVPIKTRQWREQASEHLVEEVQQWELFGLSEDGKVFVYNPKTMYWSGLQMRKGES